MPIDDKLKTWKALDLEVAAVDAGAVLFAMGIYSDWDSTLQGQTVKDFLITTMKVAESEPCLYHKYLVVQVIAYLALVSLNCPG